MTEIHHALDHADATVVAAMRAMFSAHPPVHVGTSEILLDDSRRLGSLGPVEVHVWEGMVHVFPSNVAALQAARSALDLTGAFLKQTLG